MLEAQVHLWNVHVKTNFRVSSTFLIKGESWILSENLKVIISVFWHWLWMLNFPKKVWKIVPFLCSKLDYTVTWPAGPGVVWKREIWFFFFHTCESTEFFPSRPLEFFCGPLLPVRCWPASLSENGQNVKKCHNKNVKLCCYILDLLLCLLNTMAFKDFCW